MTYATWPAGFQRQADGSTTKTPKTRLSILLALLCSACQVQQGEVGSDLGLTPHADLGAGHHDSGHQGTADARQVDSETCPDFMEELCNGADDDCDGLIDESYDAGSDCTVGHGACQRRGVIACRTPQRAECDAEPGRPSAEACNGLDDDCDGQVDEAYPELGQPCELNTGVCRSVGVVVCGEDPYQAVCSARGPDL
ncbi:MAG: MopE-related protein, partial [Myxococcota bacterium]|nr:MopE-related protein [Myxococcota bacterium]